MGVLVCRNREDALREAIDEHKRHEMFTRWGYLVTAFGRADNWQQAVFGFLEMRQHVTKATVGLTVLVAPFEADPQLAALHRYVTGPRLARDCLVSTWCFCSL